MSKVVAGAAQRPVGQMLADILIFLSCIIARGHLWQPLVFTPHLTRASTPPPQPLLLTPSLYSSPQASTLHPQPRLFTPSLNDSPPASTPHP